MILSEGRLREKPAVFRAMTGLDREEFDALAQDVVPSIAAAVTAEQDRRRGRQRHRSAGGGHPFSLSFREQLLLVVVWLRVYPTSPVLGFLFGISHPTVLRTIARVLPILEQAGRDTMRLPGHGERGRRSQRALPDLLAAIPELAVIVDTFEQRVQRPRDQEAADRHYSGKKKQHTLKSQVAIDADSGKVVDVPDSVCGPTSDLRVLQASGLLDRLDPDVGVLGRPGLRRDGGPPPDRPGVHATSQATRAPTPTRGCRLQHRVCRRTDRRRAYHRPDATLSGARATGSPSSTGPHRPRPGRRRPRQPTTGSPIRSAHMRLTATAGRGQLALLPYCAHL